VTAITQEILLQRIREGRLIEDASHATESPPALDTSST
jgi:hypothetical protein